MPSQINWSWAKLHLHWQQFVSQTITRTHHKKNCS
jgi:hypothetical protein